MSAKIRCPACRGAKKVPKLGGMIGKCNTCSGDGTILASEKPVPVKLEVVPVVAEVVEAVANCAQTTSLETQVNKALPPVEVDVKVDPKKALYKRKTVGK